MGYYSDVAIALTKKAAALLKAKLTATQDAEKYLFDHPALHNIDDATGEELWRWNYVKWYDSYPDVDFVTGFLRELDDEDFLFIRVGEDVGDIERYGCFWENAFGLDVATSIVTN